jgi:hypothetical protein
LDHRWSSIRLLLFLNVNRSIDIVERPLTKGQSPQVRYRVSGACFSALGIPIKRGREFAKSDWAKSQPAVIVNDRFEQVYLDGNTPVGLHLRTEGATPEVVGVVGSLRTTKLTTEAKPEIYVPFDRTRCLQCAWSFAVTQSLPTWFHRSASSSASAYDFSLLYRYSWRHQSRLWSILSSKHPKAVMKISSYAGKL